MRLQSFTSAHGTIEDGVPNGLQSDAVSTVAVEALTTRFTGST